MRNTDYLLSLPERFIRSVLGLGAGVAREVGEVALPDGVRGSQLYQNLVDATLRYLIVEVGGAEGVYRDDPKLPDDFLVRRAAGNAVELLGVVAFRASPVWVLAALADVCGMGRQLIPEIVDALKAQGLLEADARFTLSIRCSTGWSGPRRGSPEQSTRHRSTWRASAASGRPFAAKPETCSQRTFRRGIRSADCGPGSGRNPRGSGCRFFKRRP